MASSDKRTGIAVTDWKKVGKKSRAKGVRFERRVANMLTEITGAKWRRVQDSGRTDLKGDVFLVDQFPQRVLVECKAHNPSLKILLFGSKKIQNWQHELDEVMNKTAVEIAFLVLQTNPVLTYSLTNVVGTCFSEWFDLCGVFSFQLGTARPLTGLNKNGVRLLLGSDAGVDRRS